MYPTITSKNAFWPTLTGYKNFFLYFLEWSSGPVWVAASPCRGVSVVCPMVRLRPHGTSVPTPCPMYTKSRFVLLTSQLVAASPHSAALSHFAVVHRVKHIDRCSSVGSTYAPTDGPLASVVHRSGLRRYPDTRRIGLDPIGVASPMFLGHVSAQYVRICFTRCTTHGSSRRLHGSSHRGLPFSGLSGPRRVAVVL